MNVYVAPGGRQAVAELIQRAAGPDARVIHDPDGAPLLTGSPLNVSISHSRRYAAVAVSSRGRIGVDIEEPRLEQLRRVISKFLAPEELPMWGERLLAAWTCKEAVFKAAGVATIGLGSIRLTAPGVATVPDGRRFRLQTVETPDYTLSTAYEDN